MLGLLLLFLHLGQLGLLEYVRQLLLVLVEGAREKTLRLSVNRPKRHLVQRGLAPGHRVIWHGLRCRLRRQELCLSILRLLRLDKTFLASHQL